MDFGDKVAGAELPGQNRALPDRIQLSTPQSRLMGYDEGAPRGAGAFRILRVILSPQAADHISGVFIL